MVDDGLKIVVEPDLDALRSLESIWPQSANHGGSGPDGPHLRRYYRPWPVERFCNQVRQVLRLLVGSE